MGHLCIVTEQTLEDVKKTGCISTTGKLGNKKKNIDFKIKTTADLFSDVLAMRKGDYVFPWITKGDEGQNQGFRHIFKVGGSPFFVKGDEYPIKIPLATEGKEFPKNLKELEALDLWTKKLLWNAIGKKSLGRGRSITHQTPMEDEQLLKLLKKKNKKKNAIKIPLGNCKNRIINITIDTTQNQHSPWTSEITRLENYKQEDRLKNIELKKVPWVKGKYFSYEKVLEAWIMENIDQAACKSLREFLMDKEDKIEWFGNYLPFGVQGSNMDIVILHSHQKKRIVTVIELKVGPINKIQFRDTCDQVIEYSNFLRKAFNSFGIDVCLNPVILTATSKVSNTFSPIKKEDLQPRFISYEIEPSGNVIFKKIL